MGTTVFVVRNISSQFLRLRIFQYPIYRGETRDLLTIPYISEADIRHSLLDGELYRRLLAGDIEVVNSNIDLLQFDEVHRAWLESVGVNNGLEVHTSSGSSLLIKNEGVELRPDKNKLNFVGPGISAVTDNVDNEQANVIVSAGIAGSILIGASASAGSANALALSDHTHALAAPGAPVNVTKATANTGASTTPARADHKHDISTAAPEALAIGNAALEGSSTSLARADHQHSVAAGIPVSIGTANSSGSASTFARSDHVHNTEFSTIQTVLGGASGDISINNQNLTNVGTINGKREYGPRTTDPVTPAPSDGDSYFNTIIGAPMIYDGFRSKWLGAAAPPVYGGASGDTAAGSYFRGIDGLAFSSDRGIPVQKGTLVGVLIAMTTNVSSQVEVLVDASIIATVSVVSAGLTADLTVNSDFDQGLMKFRNRSTGDTMTNVQITANYKRRV